MKAKKSLGQNFLKSGPALRKMIEAGEVRSDDVILEIGPGKGVLTEKLLEKAGRVIAVEKDYELYGYLQVKFFKEIASGTLTLLHEDILEFEIERQDFKTYKIIANIPYNITGAILKKFLTAEHQPQTMVLMVQNEVGKRIVAQDGKESILSISVKAYGNPKLVLKVGKRYFSPAPKVDSVIIAIKNISRRMFEENQVNEEKFWELIKAGFAHKRKKLSSNLKQSLRETSVTTLEGFGNKRAEDLLLTDWISLAKDWFPDNGNGIIEA